MNIRSEVIALKQQLEQLFPGKWVSGNSETQRHKNIFTGLAEIDGSLVNGLQRQKITEWIGEISSGKTTFLRTLVSTWCASGMRIAYVDAENRLLASDWITNTDLFWVVRLPADKKEMFWSAEQLIRSHAFDVVILDLAGNKFSPHNQSRIYARLQRALDKSRTSLLILKDISATPHKDNSWGCHAQFSFAWQRTNSQNGLAGIVALLPTVNLSVLKDGISKQLEITPYKENNHVPNCLFTHPPIPDRRTSKT